MEEFGFDFGFDDAVEPEALVPEEEKREAVAVQLRKHSRFSERWTAFKTAAPYRLENGNLFVRDGVLFDALALRYNVAGDVRMASGSNVQFFSAQGLESSEGSLDHDSMIYKRHRMPSGVHVIKAIVGGIGADTETLWLVYADEQLIRTDEVAALEWLALCVRNSSAELAECPALVGHVKQIAWGEMLRAKAFRKLQQADWSDWTTAERLPFVEQTKARYWIDRYGTKAA